MNRGTVRRVLPDLHTARVEFIKAEQVKGGPDLWVARLLVNGWPFDLRIQAKDELDVMKTVFALQRGEQVHGVFNVSK